LWGKNGKTTLQGRKCWEKEVFVTSPNVPFDGVSQPKLLTKIEFVHSLHFFLLLKDFTFAAQKGTPNPSDNPIPSKRRSSIDGL